MGTERCRELNAEFCHRHLPSHAPNGRALLLDWDGKIAFAPDEADLYRCVAEYTTLVEEATRDDPCDILYIREASDLALAYLYRGLEAHRALPERVLLERLVRRVYKVLRASAEWFGRERWEDEMRWYDGFQTPEAIASLLETVLGERAFCQQFLPRGTSDAHALLVDFARVYSFTPSAAELQQCLDAYTALMRKATRVSCVPARWCVAATEVALAYLSRALEAGTPLPERATVNGLIVLLRQTLASAVALFGSMRWYEGFKRIDLLAWLLEEHAPRGVQGWHVFRSRLRSVLRIG